VQGTHFDQREEFCEERLGAFIIPGANVLFLAKPLFFLP
jgi:hypothetical protein